jgi:hypothetical protein
VGGSRSLVARARAVFAVTIASCVGASFAACGSNYASGPDTGKGGGPCYGNGTCDPGLACVSDTCTLADGGTPAPDGSANDGAMGPSTNDGATSTDALSSTDAVSSDGALVEAAVDGGDVGYMFVTSATVTVVTDFVGVTEADTFCTNAANASVKLVGRKWKAWLSDGTTSALAHMTPGLKGTYIRTDGALIGSPSVFLAGGKKLANPPNLSETGTVVDCTNDGPWTGTTQTGSAAADLCKGWTSGASTDHGVYGDCTATDFNWTATSSGNCDHLARLYCFEQN